MALLSKKDTNLILDPLADNNPITIQVLGICSALAITAELKASIVMAISVLFVMGMGNIVISLLRNLIPPKMKSIPIFVLAVFCYVQSYQAQNVQFNIDEINIDYERFVLPNGLTLLVHEDHKAPIVAVNVWYHVGSKNEKQGKSGFAHLF